MGMKTKFFRKGFLLYYNSVVIEALLLEASEAKLLSGWKLRLKFFQKPLNTSYVNQERCSFPWRLSQCNRFPMDIPLFFFVPFLLTNQRKLV